jgi:hypothetical protein
MHMVLDFKGRQINGKPDLHLTTLREDKEVIVQRQDRAPIDATVNQQ